MPTSWGIGFYTLMISLETLKNWSRAGPGVGREVVVETTSKNVGKKIVIDPAESLRSSSVQPGLSQTNCHRCRVHLHVPIWLWQFSQKLHVPRNVCSFAVVVYCT